MSFGLPARFSSTSEMLSAVDGAIGHMKPGPPGPNLSCSGDRRTDVILQMRDISKKANNVLSLSTPLPLPALPVDCQGIKYGLHSNGISPTADLPAEKSVCHTQGNSRPGFPSRNRAFGATGTNRLHGDSCN